ncbi:DNA polymerase III subunit beta [Streptomyces sp. HUAS MG47]|uniref:DNA polymerase III subunit beta n=1 Tax=Streptomyces solicamelliae TaxID=3231716 RepID=UPI003877FD8D
MELRIDSSVLTDVVAWAARVLPVRAAVPVLGGLLLEAQGDGLVVSGLDHEAAARTGAAADVAVPGRALVLGRRLVDICKVLPRSPVELAVEGSRLSVTGGDVRFGLSLLPLDDYPAQPALPEQRGVVDADAFADAVAQVAPAAGRDESLPVLTGIRLALDGDTMTLAATDRYRYALRTLEWKAASAEAADVVAPARRLTEIARSLAGAGDVRLSLDAGSVGFESGAMRTTTRLLDGRLPRHDKLFDLGDPVTAVTDRAALLEAVKRVAVVADGGSPLQLEFTGDALRLRAGYEDDVAFQCLPAALSSDEPMTVAFNPAYLLDALGSFDVPEIRFHLLGPGQRALLTDPTGAAHRHLLMSVKPPLV